MRTVVTLVLCGLAAQAAELPVRQVILYKHGIGFFERAGRLGAGESARLDFKASEMNDVLRNIELSTASAIRFTVAQLQQQFRDYLAALTSARSQDKRSVYIDSTDSKARDVVASYTIPAAVWKSSYRLMLNAAGKPTLEGWAIVDNTTGEDWTKVTLALVSGRPISFISQLYAPRYINRPIAELPEDRAQAPVIHEGAFASAPGGVIGGIAGAAPMAAPAPPPVERRWFRWSGTPGPPPRGRTGCRGSAPARRRRAARGAARP